MNQLTQLETILLLETYDEAYERGDPLVSDIDYDQTKRAAQKRFPNDPYFIRVGSTVRGGEVLLPYQMGSLDQVHEGEYSKWVGKYGLKNKEVFDSQKLDGMSGMVQFNLRNLQVGYQRGDGVKGFDMTRHLQYIKNLPQTIPHDGYLTVRGELIMPKDVFAAKWSGEFANPRNMVSGIINRKVSDQEALGDIDFVVYQIVASDIPGTGISHTQDLEILRSLGFSVVDGELGTAGDFDDEKLSAQLKSFRKKSKYELDGIVITINQSDDRKSLSNSSSLNPEHSVKFKILDKDSIVETTVVDVHYELSQHGFEKPRVEVIPVSLFGTVVTFATGFNGRFIVDNGIGPGAIIKITKGGSVIPDILEVVQPAEPKLPSEPWHWNKTKTEMRVNNYETHPDVIFKQVLQFFVTLEIDLLKEASLKNIIEHYGLENQTYDEIITTVFGLLEPEWVRVIGSNGSKIYASISRKSSALTLETFLGAVKHLGFGFGVRKAKALLRSLDSPSDVWTLTVDQIEQIDGFDKTAGAIVEGLPKAKALLDALGIETIVQKKTSELAELNVVFTGFRDKEFQERLERSGAKVGSSVSKKTTHVLTAEPNSQSSKAIKARQLGIKTLSIDEFKDLFNL
jgi:DNA ligase (NAD+)